MGNYLVVEKGLPYEPGYKIPILDQQVMLGRASKSEKPDIDFENKFISRKHCLLMTKEMAITLTDLASKHGTFVNKKPAIPDIPIELKHNDKIILAQGAAILRIIINEELSDETLELTQTNLSSLRLLSDANAKKLQMNIAKRQCLVNNSVIQLSPKEWQLLLLLYNNASQTVYYDTIKSAVWPERITTAGEIPLVGLEEISLLLYRLRHKLRNQGHLIRNIRGLGCILEL